MQFGEVIRFYRAIDIILTSEHERMIDIISFPHATKQARQRIINHYIGTQQQMADGKAMALRFANKTRRTGEEWPRSK